MSIEIPTLNDLIEKSLTLDLITKHIKQYMDDLYVNKGNTTLTIIRNRKFTPNAYYTYGDFTGEVTNKISPHIMDKLFKDILIGKELVINKTNENELVIKHRYAKPDHRYVIEYNKKLTQIINDLEQAVMCGETTFTVYDSICSQVVYNKLLSEFTKKFKTTKGIDDEGHDYFTISLEH